VAASSLLELKPKCDATVAKEELQTAAALASPSEEQSDSTLGETLGM
jgi:hypothetical protein